MEIKIRNSKDFYAGLIFIFFAVFFISAGRNYPMGTASRMGLSMFPFILAGLLAFLGLVLMARSPMAEW